MPLLPSKTVIIIYAIGYLAMAALTVKYLYPLWSDYIHRNIATEIELVNGNDSRTAPSLVMCIPYDNTAWTEIDLIKPYKGCATCPVCNRFLCDLDYDSGPTWARSFIPNATKPLADIVNVIKASLIDDIFFKKINDPNLISDMSQRHYLTAALEFFRCLTQTDANFPSTDKPCSPYRSGELPEKWRIHTVLDRLLDVVSSHIACYETPAVETCISSISLLSGIKKILNESNTFAFGKDTMCFHLPKNINGFSLFYSGSFAIGQWFNGQPIYVEHPIAPYRIYEDRGESVLQFVTKSSQSMAQYSKLYQSPPAPPNSRSPNAEIVDLQYRTTNRIVETRPSVKCIQDQDLASCILRCKLEKIVNTCRCVPFTYRKMIAVEYQFLPYCIPDDDRYRKNCTGILSEVVGTCTEECGANPCQYTYNDWLITSSGRLVDIKDAGLRVTVTPILSPFPQMSIVYKDSSESFLANVGGVANLYLGVDGLCLCAILIFFIDQFKDYVKKGRRIDVADEPTLKDLTKFGQLD